MQLKNEFAPIIQWASKKGLLTSGTPEKQFIKLQEEIGELAVGLLTRNKDLVKDSIGDCVVVLTILAHLSDTSIEECVVAAYDEIKGRTGNMKDGVFVKDQNP